MIYLLLICFVIVLILLIIVLNKNVQLRINLEKENKKEKDSLIRKLEDEARSEFQPKIDEYERRLRASENLVRKEEEKRELLQREIRTRQESLDSDIAARRKSLESQLETEFLLKRKNEEEKLQSYFDSLLEKKKENEIEIEEIKQTLEDFRHYQDSINEDNLRKLKIESDKDFYRIVIPDTDLEDIELLRDIAPRLKRKEELNKLIWSLYYQKPTSEMEKRILQGRSISGIYKITSLKTGLIYIGKSTDLKRRWTDHCKTALGAGTLASSTLHTTMRAEGPENFTFEILEETEKDKLRERESFYIELYGTKNKGLNTVK